MATLKEALKIKTLWRGKPTFVAVHIPMKELSVGWDSKKEEPLKQIDFDPDKDGLILYANGKEVASIILVAGSATFYRIDHIQKQRNAIQLFTKSVKA